MKKEMTLNLDLVQKFIDDFQVTTIHSISKKPKTYYLNSKIRASKVIYSRMVVFDFLYKNGMTYAGIGELFDKSGTHGKMDHATVRYQIKKLSDRLVYKDVREIHDEVTEMINNYFFSNNAYYSDDICLKEMISICNLETELFKNFPNLATQNDSYSFKLEWLGKENAVSL